MKKQLRAISLGGLGRLATMAVLNQGITLKDSTFSKKERLLYRTHKLMLFDNYLNNLQYTGLEEWNPDLVNQQIDDRQYQPKKIFPLPSIAVNTFRNHLTTEESRLNVIHDDVDTQKVINDFIDETMLWTVIDSALGSYLANGSMFIRFYTTSSDKVIIETHNTKFVYPTFGEDNELEEVYIRYIYQTEEYDDSNKQFVWRWSQYKLDKYTDIMYNNPIYDQDSDYLPKFSEVEHIEHNMGFVQGEWIKTSCCTNYNDGSSFLENGVTQYLDDFNYISSKQSSAIYYGLFPILLHRGPDSIEGEQIDMGSRINDNKLSNHNVISTGRPPGEADLSFLEAGQHAMNYSNALQEKSLQLMQYIMNTVLLDPERVASHAQSGRAMEALYKPVVQYIKQKRPFLKKGIVALLNKLEIVSNANNTEFKLPTGSIKASDMKWGNIFSDTVQEVATRVNYTASLFGSGIISKETAIKHVANDLDIKSVTEEMGKINEDKESEIEDEQLRFNASNPPQGEPQGNQQKPSDNFKGKFK